MARATKAGNQPGKPPAIKIAKLSKEKERELVELLDGWESEKDDEDYAEERASAGLDFIAEIYSEFKDGVPKHLLPRVTKAVEQADSASRIVYGD